MQPQLEKTTARHDEMTVPTVEQISEPENREQIAALAYEFWRARGCPEGTSEEDWFRAEQEIAGSKRIDEKEVRSRDSAEGGIDAEEEAVSLVLRFPVRSEVFQGLTRGHSRRAPYQASHQLTDAS